MSGWAPPQVAVLPGDRLHLQHGPIDLVIKADGEPRELRLAHAAAVERFGTVLGELVGELPLLRAPLSGGAVPRAEGDIANRMIDACWPHRAVFITPMAAVAGSVADEIAAMMREAAPRLRSLYVNNGGDIAVHVAAGETLRIGVVPDLVRAVPDGVVLVDRESGIGGIATSGWRGRSFSLGIADAVTVLARSAAEADAAATIVANAVDLRDAAVLRRSARELDPDSDLHDLPVTKEVGILSEMARGQALRGGVDAAERLMRDGRILGAMIALQNEVRIVG